VGKQKGCIADDDNINDLIYFE
jgi:hypothetical protein